MYKLAVVFALIALSACKAGTSEREPKATGGSGAGGVGVGGQEVVAGSGGCTAGNQCDVVSSGGAPHVSDDYDDSGCEHPEVISDCRDGWCTIPPGCFIMGSPESEWGHVEQETRAKVTLTREFVIGQKEVTQAEWTSLGLSNPSRIYKSGDFAGEGDCLEPACPVGNVSWLEAVSYANLLSERDGVTPCYQLQGPFTSEQLAAHCPSSRAERGEEPGA